LKKESDIEKEITEILEESNSDNNSGEKNV